MGTGLEMTGKGKPRAVAALAMACLFLAGCGNTPDRIAYGDLAKTVFRQTPAQAPEAAQAENPALILSRTEASVIVAEKPGHPPPFYLIEIRQNGPYRTYATGGRQSITFRQGLVTASRGLGNDLMASEIAPTLDLLKRQSGGTVQRRMHYLDGADETVDLLLRCTITTGDTLRVTLAEIDQTARRMSEDCRGDGVAFRNEYLVNGAGTVLGSRQWMSPMTGTLTFQMLRH